MARHARSSWDTDVLPPAGRRRSAPEPNPPRRSVDEPPRPASRRRRSADEQQKNTRRPRRMLVVGRIVAALAALLVLVLTGTIWGSYYRITTGGITTSQALVGGSGSAGGAQNILIMGLDSRLDQRGEPLPAEIYDALHAGDETVGGYNANVLIVLHIPAGDGPITAISIPRDDYVELAGCPTSDCKGKVKQAYGFAYQHALESTDSSSAGSVTDPVMREQMAREAGRKAEIETVRQLLGIPIDHFVEVTLVAFFQIAQVVQPITVCLNADTSDSSYSGANFRQGVQQIDAAQAMSFVRQRRDINDEMFTDMDRTRRQQAFIASLMSALRHGGALSNPTTLRHLLDVARQNVAVDSGFDLADFVRHASGFADRSMSLYTLPIAEFGQNSEGEDVNIIDVPTIRAIVHGLVAGDTPDSPAPPPEPATPTVLNVVNATAHTGLAGAVIEKFSSRGFTAGEASTADSLAETSSISYGPGAHDAAQILADQFHLTATEVDTAAANSVQLTVGSDFPASDYLDGDHSESETSTPSSPVPTAAATATGSAAPVPTDLSRMSGSDVPCVK